MGHQVGSPLERNSQCRVSSFLRGSTDAMPISHFNRPRTGRVLSSVARIWVTSACGGYYLLFLLLPLGQTERPITRREFHIPAQYSAPDFKSQSEHRASSVLADRWRSPRRATSQPQPPPPPPPHLGPSWVVVDVADGQFIAKSWDDDPKRIMLLLWKHIHFFAYREQREREHDTHTGSRLHHFERTRASEMCIIS